MITIKKADEKTAKTLGKQKPKVAEYRLMKYVLSCDTDDGILLHNVISGEMCYASDAEARIISSLPAKYSEDMDEFIGKYYLVPTDFDEKKTVYQLRRVLSLFSLKHSIDSYTVLPTTNCNARCFYCYEAGVEHVNMSRETAELAVRFIREHCSDKKSVKLSWFGGEPTVAADRIDEICDGLAEAGIEYRSSMISNGYLFSRDMAKLAKEKWKLGKIQITLDGTEEIYNKVKAYVGVKGSPYLKVLDNIGYLLDEGINVNIRMNLDSHNYDNLAKLINELSDRFGDRENFGAYVMPLFDDCGFTPVRHSEDDRLRLITKQTELNKLIKEKSAKSAGNEGLPKLKINHCMADNDSSVIIDASGKLAKCEHTFATESVGDLVNGITDEATVKAWKETVEYGECESCPLFPMCVNLKKCFSTGACYAEKRNSMTDGYIKNMLTAYNKYKEKETKE